MTELEWRIAILAIVALLVAGSIWLRRRRVRGRAEQAHRPDLGPGVHLFSSATCATCAEARQVLARACGDQFTEVRFEDDQARFGSFGIASVPTVFALGANGTGFRWEGVPRFGELRRSLNAIR